MPILARSRSFRAGAAAIVLGVLVGLAPTAPVSAATVAFNGECRIAGTPVDASGTLRAFGRIGCIHYIPTVDGRLQLWREAGATGRNGDVLLADTGWTTLPVTIQPPYGQRMTLDAACRARPRQMKAYARFIVRSAVVRDGGAVKTSSWGVSDPITIKC